MELIPSKAAELRARILAGSQPLANGCRIWLGRLDDSGYGTVRIGDGRKTTVHRAAYMAWVGPIADDDDAHHECNNTSCVEWSHIKPLDGKTNTLLGNSVSAMAARQTHCVNGHPFDEKNTRQDRRGRACRICCATRARELRRQRKGIMVNSHR